MAICRAGWRVVYEPAAIAWTEAPRTLGQLWRQRYRWCYGTLQAMWKHKRAVLERGSSGKLGRRGLPYLLVFQVILPMIAPVVDLATIYGFFLTDYRLLAGTWLTFLLLQLLAAAYAFTLDSESPRPLWALITQQFVYRQLMYLVVIQSISSACYGIRLRWHKIPRTGTSTQPAQSRRQLRPHLHDTGVTVGEAAMLLDLRPARPCGCPPPGPEPPHGSSCSPPRLDHPQQPEPSTALPGRTGEHSGNVGQTGDPPCPDPGHALRRSTTRRQNQTRCIRALALRIETTVSD